jgi:hypothetical protein
MPRHIYSPLSRPHSIRLLLLLPREEDLNNVRCKLFEYPLRNWDGPSHPYEALSYVWGSEDKPCSILVNDRKLSITQNLYTLLLHLQVHDCLRTIWVDAICINQTDEKEKESQISFMAEIYAKASRVLVWLGEEEDNSDEAIEAIRLAGQKLVLLDDPEQAILRLLQRQWFQRIWVRG